MNRDKLEKEIIQFRDDLKEYQKIVRDIWSIGRNYSGQEKIKELKKTKEAI